MQAARNLPHDTVLSVEAGGRGEGEGLPVGGGGFGGMSPDYNRRDAIGEEEEDFLTVNNDMSSEGNPGNLG